MGNSKSKKGSGSGSGSGVKPPARPASAPAGDPSASASASASSKAASKRLKPSQAQRASEAKTKEERMAEYKANLERRDSTPQAFAEDMAKLLSQRDEGKEMEALSTSDFGHAVTEAQFDLLRHEWRTARRQWKYEALVSRNLTMLLRRHVSSYMSLTVKIAPLIASFLEVPEAKSAARRGSVLRSSGRIQNAVLHARLSALLGIEQRAQGGKADGTGEGEGLSLGALAGSVSSGDEDDSTEPSGLTPTASSPLSSNYSSQMNSARSAATDPARYSLDHSSVFTSDFEDDDDLSGSGTDTETETETSVMTSVAHSDDDEEDGGGSADEEDGDEEADADAEDEEDEEEESEIGAADGGPAVTKAVKKKAKVKNVGDGGGGGGGTKKKAAATGKKKKEKVAAADGADEPKAVKKFKTKAATPTAADAGAKKMVKTKKKKKKAAASDAAGAGSDAGAAPKKKKKVKAKKDADAASAPGDVKKTKKVKKAKSKASSEAGDDAPASSKSKAAKKLKAKKAKVKREKAEGGDKANGDGDPTTPTTPAARKKEIKSRLRRSHTLSAGMAVQLTAHMQRRERSDSVDSNGSDAGSRSRLRARRNSTIERSQSGTLDGASLKAAQRVARRRSLGGMTPDEMERLQQIARHEERERRKRQVIEEQKRRLARVTERRRRRAARERELQELMRALLEMPCIYTSEVSGNRMVKSHTRKIRWLFESLEITYRVVDVSLDHEEKEYMQNSSGSSDLPQVFVTDRYRGGWEAIETAHERGQLRELIAPDPEGGIAAPVGGSGSGGDEGGGGGGEHARRPSYMAPTKSSSFRVARDEELPEAASAPPPVSPASAAKMPAKFAAAAGVNGQVLLS